MTDKDQRRKPGKPAARPAASAASGPVVPSAPLPATPATQEATPLPPIGSTLVGSGGTLPPMAARAAGTEARTDQPAAAAKAADAPTTTAPAVAASPDATAPSGGTETRQPPATPEAKAAEAVKAPAAHAAEASAATTPSGTETRQPPATPEAKTVDRVKAPAAGTSPASPMAATTPVPPSPAGPKPLPATPEARPAATPARPAARRGGFWPLVLGGVVAAGLGAGATWWAIPHLPEAWRPGPVIAAPEPAPPPDLQALKDEILAELPVNPAPTVDEAALNTAVAAALDDARPQIEAAAREAADDELTRRLAEAPAGSEAPDALAATVQAQGERLDALDRQLAELAAAPSPAPAATPAESAPATGAPNGNAAALTTLRDEVAALKTQVDDLAARPAGATTQAVGELAAKLDAAEAQLAALPPRLDALEAGQAGLAAAARLGEALRAGNAEGVAAAAEALGAAGHGDLAQMARNLPTLAELQSGYDRAARDALAAVRKGDSSLGAFFAAQTNARSITPREGDDPDAVQSRAGAAVEAGDIAAALRELEAMPEAGRAAMADWLARAEAWMQAQDALGQITQPATQSE